MEKEMEGYWKSEIRRGNSERVKTDERCQKAISSMKKVESLLINFGYLSFGRDFVLINSQFISMQRISISLELTMGSVISCCKSGCIADANALLRKYRDDLFFYLYIIVYDSMHRAGVSSTVLSKMEAKISSWLENELKNLQISTVLKDIALSPLFREVVRKYGLQESFEKIGKKLNNYVHSNGYYFYNQNANEYKGDALSAEMASLADDAKYITVVFLFLLILCAPFSVMAEDYTDYLDCQETPPEGSEYWVAPFIQRFIHENISMIDENCIDYLKEHSEMEI